jgi:site-specific DNA-methyltransferase (adenine-specific)
MLKINKIYNQDCLEGMKQLDNNSIDLIVTDPPYGLKIDKLVYSKGKLGKVWGKSATLKKDYGDIGWDDKALSKEVFKEMVRISKNQIIFGANHFTEIIPSSRGWIVWDKDNGDNDFSDCELAFTSFNMPIRKFKWRWSGMLQEDMKNKEKRYHPTQKPIALGRWILQKFANKGDIIFDPFAGSGSFLLACKQLNFNYIGCESDKDYYNIILDRLKQTTLHNLK